MGVRFPLGALMKIRLRANNLPMTIPQLMRQAGYVYLPGRGGDDSYIRVMGRSPYPRFHVYIQERDNQLIINLHLDQKQPGYGVSTRHNGEYEGPVVETEARRLIQLISHA